MKNYVAIELEIGQVTSVLISPFSAVPSWEGYEYQGHIAIFVVLKKIKELLSVSNIEIDMHTLEIEGVEDFSIKRENKYLTLHQVKYGALALNNKDKFCFLISVLQYKANKGYFHITSGNTLPTDFAKVTYETILALKREFSCEVINANETVNLVEQEKNQIIVDSITANHPKGSKYSILKFVLSGMKLEITKENVDKAIEAIRNELEDYEGNLLHENLIVSDSVFLASYGSLFNSISDVKNASYILIGEILDILDPDWKIGTSSSNVTDYPQFIYGQVLLFLKRKISICHEANKSCNIGFSEIFFKLSEDYRKELNSIEYQYYTVWKNIQESFEGYPNSRISQCISNSCFSCVDNNSCNLHKQKQLIQEISEEEIHVFLYRLMLKNPELGKPNNLPDDNLIGRLFSDLLKEIKLLCFEKNNLIQAQKNGLFYRLTLNSSGEKHELQDQLEKEIRTSFGDKLLIYESDVLITDQLNEDEFIYNGIDTTVIGGKEFEDMKDITGNSIDKIKKNYSKPKIMRLVDRKNAKEELNK